MSLFPETIKAHLGGRNVRMAYLVLFDFDGEPMRVWSGVGKLITSGGVEWYGLGNIGSISGLEQAVNGEAPETTFVMSGVDPTIVRLTRDEFETKAKNRLVQVMVQFCNDDNDKALELFDAPYPIWAGRMQIPRFEMEGPSARKITVSAESLFSLRSRPSSSMYTDVDQRNRYPGDLGFEFVPTLINKTVTWPDF